MFIGKRRDIKLGEDILSTKDHTTKAIERFAIAFAMPFNKFFCRAYLLLLFLFGGTDDLDLLIVGFTVLRNKSV